MAAQVRALTGAVFAAAVAAGCAPVQVAAVPRGELGAIAILKELYTLQRGYRAQYDAYASTTGELRTVGWDDNGVRDFYPWIVHHGRRLCVAALPKRRSLGTWSIDGRGTIWRGPYCGRPW
jgi:hypothetical protein